MRKISLDNLAEDIDQLVYRGASAAQLLSGLADMLMGDISGRAVQLDDRVRESVRALMPTLRALLESRDPFEDTFGELYMRLASRGTQSGLGQYFTPMSLARGVAAMNLSGELREGIVTIHDPACGAGAMLLAAMELMLARGRFSDASLTGVDKDPVCALMCAAQMLWACHSVGVMPAHMAVLQGNSLTLRYHDMVLLATRPDLTFEEARALPFMPEQIAARWHRQAGHVASRIADALDLSAALEQHTRPEELAVGSDT